MQIDPFAIEISDATLTDLHARLARTRWPDEIADAGWDYGVNRAYLQEVVTHWRDHYDWRREERALNQLHHFRAQIGALRIHFVHQRGRGDRPMPLVITHGWPGSFVELLKLIPLLTDPAHFGGDARDAFDVVIPSLPGYGFSDPPAARGMNAFAIADMWAALMEGLGYTRYGAQGGDWGASVSTCLGWRHQAAVAGVHLNYIPGSYRPCLRPDEQLSPAERAFLESHDAWGQREGGYAHVQRTRPQTLAFALNDSPAGLAAWIIDKLRAWSDCDGDVERCFSKDEMLTNVMIYWVTASIHASMRLYYESRLRPLHFADGDRVHAPCGIIRFAKEAPFPPREWVERSYNVQQWTEVAHGGHFAAWEQPAALADDIRSFFRPLRS